MVQPEGKFSVDKHDKGILIVLTEDGLFGTVYPIPADKQDEFHTVVLKPSATVKFRLGDPGVKVYYGITYWSHGVLSTQTTDAEGVATFRLPPGTGDYLFVWGEKEYRDSNRKEKEFNLTLKPGETVEIAP
jgi:hypothetical protein